MDYKDNKDPRVAKNTNFRQSLRHAIDGIKVMYHEERNFRKHLVVAAIMIVMGICFQLKQTDWLWLFVAIFSVIILESINTVTEALVDLITDYKYHPLAKKVKDVAAGAVLMTSFFAVIIGIFIFLPHIIHFIIK